MKFFDLDEIRRVGDCVAFVRDVVGTPVANGRCAAVWRGGDNPSSVALTTDQWYDHVEKQGGGIIELAQIAVTGGDFHKAITLLGEHYRLTELKLNLRRVGNRTVVAEYVYCNVNGEPVHKTVRYEPKAFAQYRFDGGQWVTGLDDITPVLYRLPEIAKADTVWIAEGEKDADNLAKLGLAATTVAMGADKWHDSYTPYLAGKHVVITRDNDDAGSAHAQRVCWELRNAAKSLKVLCPSQTPKGDVSDWLADGGTRDQLLAMAEQADSVNVADAQEPVRVAQQREMSTAKKANKDPYRNYKVGVQVTADGSEKQITIGRTLEELVDDLNARFWGFPRLAGEALFDQDREHGGIRRLIDAEDMFAWIDEKSGHNSRFKRGEGMIGQERLFRAVRATARRYNAIADVPHWPLRDDVYYTYADLPEPTTDGEFLNRLCA